MVGIRRPRTLRGAGRDPEGEREVVTVHRAQQIDHEVGLTMELIKGRPLAHIVEQTGPMGAIAATMLRRLTQRYIELEAESLDKRVTRASAA